ncbi:TIGR02536 family ethanolamine utilization protein [Clostridium sp. CCUG 7971]|uniref:TIGR02536 family ethanolamine utilization protein n=1 Tax=Clostridium sp. CCUG 7971 TaxID=2811414 RepID=UPI001ABB40B5|nr:TIGR02536 family ethanolamine utilization protein [Clostridium sp. CCUG 7971]MBO3443115.1 TIGR02536 family ethanolamine utilization protein [Clostridium sp. CCUG 7971]
MDYNKLIDLIVDEIYKKINDSKVSEVKKLPKCVVLWEKDENRFNLLKNNFEVLSYDESIRESDIVIISRLCLRGLSNLSIGNSTSNEERFILKMLMMGKKVYIMEDGLEYKRYKSSAPKALYNKYISFEQELKKFGVNVIKDIFNILDENKSTSKEEINNSNETIIDKAIEVTDEVLDLRNKKLISESDLRKPQMNGVSKILIGKKSIVTPLANDFIRIHHLKLNRV